MSRWPPHDCYPNRPDINGCTCTPMCSGWKEHNARMNQKHDPARRIDMKNGGYTDEQIEAMKFRVAALPAEEKYTFESLLRSMTLLRDAGDFTTPGVLEQHYGLAPPVCCSQCGKPLHGCTNCGWEGP